MAILLVVMLYRLLQSSGHPKYFGLFGANGSAISVGVCLAFLAANSFINDLRPCSAIEGFVMALLIISFWLVIFSWREHEWWQWISAV